MPEHSSTEEDGVVLAWPESAGGSSPHAIRAVRAKAVRNIGYSIGAL